MHGMTHFRMPDLAALVHRCCSHTDSAGSGGRLEASLVGLKLFADPILFTLLTDSNVALIWLTPMLTPMPP